MRVLLDHSIDTAYGRFELNWYFGGYGLMGAFDENFAGQQNGLAGAADPDGVLLNLALWCGGSPVRIELHERDPGVSPSWEDIVEVSVSVPDDARPGWCSWANESYGELDLPSGQYRLRVSASGRDAAHQGEPADRYLLELWPKAPAPDAIIRTTSRDAAYCHSAMGNRRSAEN